MYPFRLQILHPSCVPNNTRKHFPICATMYLALLDSKSKILLPRTSGFCLYNIYNVLEKPCRMQTTFVLFHIGHLECSLCSSMPFIAISGVNDSSMYILPSPTIGASISVLWAPPLIFRKSTVLLHLPKSCKKIINFRFKCESNVTT